MSKENFATKEQITWCPGCYNFLILDSFKKAVEGLVKTGSYNKKDFAITTGIGCHGKIFDYLNINGFYGLHGRPIPTAMGIKLGNPNMNVIAFAGDGDTYSEGMSHFIHAFRYNPDMTLIVHDNQSFSLTTGQATPTSQQGFINNVNPYGEFNIPFNPLRLALSAGATFIARCNPKDIKHTSAIIQKAIKHKGFSYIEMIQRCVIFNKDMNSLDKLMYKIKDNSDYKKALELVEQWDYNSPKKGKIPIGVIYKSKNKVKTLNEKMSVSKS
ncbi:2-oxoacid:ferredoxin oxidoreductase subunit beta [Candidatus Pacearchaeota archaeon]|nr:2-oxoacid:ferredoxin oxidoreductase subunit beta [Candidatus Pacearchaeota archaeon]